MREHPVRLVLQEAPEDPFDPNGPQLWQIAAYTTVVEEGVCLTGRFRTADEALDALDLHEQLTDSAAVLGALAANMQALRRHVDTLRVVARVLVRAAGTARQRPGVVPVDLENARVALTEARYQADERGD